MKLINDSKSYMIRRWTRSDADDGHWVYSKGGHRPRFSETGGKVWTSIGKVKSHLAMFRTYQGTNEVPEDWEVIEVRLVSVNEPVNARDMVQPNADKQAERQAAYKNRFEKERADAEKRQLKLLKEKYEGTGSEVRTSSGVKLKLILPGLK